LERTVTYGHHRLVESVGYFRVFALQPKKVRQSVAGPSVAVGKRHVVNPKDLPGAFSRTGCTI
jgi:hypothetical protein